MKNCCQRVVSRSCAAAAAAAVMAMAVLRDEGGGGVATLTRAARSGLAAVDALARLGLVF